MGVGAGAVAGMAPHTFIRRMMSPTLSPVARLSFTTSTKPAVLTGGSGAGDGGAGSADGGAGGAYRYLLMPVRLSG